MRGEHGDEVGEGVGPGGSSPRARGALAIDRMANRWHGIIPACAGSTRACDTSKRPVGDHPRVRGEHPAASGDTGGSKGSSPRARGAQRPVRRPGDRDGIIPACAGSTSGTPQARRQRRDHPRVRGEHYFSRSFGIDSTGSSPRARGALVQGDGGRGHEGIIPACAGSTGKRPAIHRRPGDHPRVRGEHGRIFRRTWVGVGSSPRARGALERTIASAMMEGIIPACAGSTPENQGKAPHPMWIIPACAGSTAQCPVASLRDWDHPRVRGEHRRRSSSSASVGGSSPRARGARVDLLAFDPPAGIIPACAGSTSGSSRPRFGPRDHPRVRGEHLPGSRPGHPRRGSSPRARGALRSGPLDVDAEGIIPACAGSTTTEVSSQSHTSDHPRVRGEHHAPRSAPGRPPGSSPRARGAQVCADPLPAEGGIIPACAGSTAPPAVPPGCPGDHPRVRGEHSLQRSG